MLLLIAALLVVLHPIWCQANPALVRRVALACAPGCDRKGNCDAERGLCHCPWGWEGPTCEVDRMAACRQSPDDPGSCGSTVPKNCECYRACYRLYCPNRPSAGEDWEDACLHGSGRGLQRAHCFLYGSGGEPAAGGASGRTAGGGGGRTAEAAAAVAPPHGVNDSAFPESPGAVTWYRHIPEAAGYETYDVSFLAPVELEGASGVFEPAVQLHPLSRCPAACSNGRGACVQLSADRPAEISAERANEDASAPEGQGGAAAAGAWSVAAAAVAPRCWCRIGYRGKACEAVREGACWVAPGCGGGAGAACRSGFCHCPRGRWGLGCGRSRAFAAVEAGGPLPDLRSPTRLRIYVYELPWQVAMPYEFTDGDTFRDPNYTAFEYFLRYLLQDDAVRTENPYEATLFYVPLLLYWYAGNTGPQHLQADAVLKYVQQSWPFFNRSGGRDHVYFVPGDRGACHLPRWLQEGPIKMVHFGLQAAHLDWLAMSHNQEYGCLRVARDLVVPPYIHFGRTTTRYYAAMNSSGGSDPRRDRLLFFAGSLRTDQREYSGGARQAVAKLVAGLDPRPPDVLFAEGYVEDYAAEYRRSTFCLAPYGFGYGMRLYEAMVYGCIPVVLQDSVYQAYEEFVPYEEFSVRVPNRDVPRLLEILRSFDPARASALRLGLARWHPAFNWDRGTGGRAYEQTIRGLQRRAHNLLAGYFR